MPCCDEFRGRQQRLNGIYRQGQRCRNLDWPSLPCWQITPASHNGIRTRQQMSLIAAFI